MTAPLEEMDTHVPSEAAPAKDPNPSSAVRPRAIAVAFECEPDAGSEAGAGWGMVKSIAEFADVTVLVGSRHLSAINQWLTAEPDARLTFVGVPTHSSRLMRLLIRLHRQFEFVLYLLWIRSARTIGQQMHKDRAFDVSVHVAYGSYWLPTPAVDIGPPTVWGPVGGATVTPWRLLPLLGWKGVLGEFEGRIMIWLFSMLPSTRRTWRKATIAVTETYQTRRALPRRMRSKTRVINRAMLSRVPAVPDVKRSSYLVFPSSLQARKGPRLAVQALAHTPDWVHLRFVSSGYEEASLKRLAQELGVRDRVEFHGRIPRDEMFGMYAEAAAVVFAGLREEGGCALSEAMLVGAPVVVLGHAGPRIIAETNTDPSRVAIVDVGTPKATAEAMGAAMTRFCENPSTATGCYLDQESVEEALGSAILDAANARST